MLTIYASFAQEESRGQSDSIKWQKRKKQEKGEMTNGSVPYGYRYKDGEISIDPEKAKNVEMIFRDFAENGLSLIQVRDKLNAAGIAGKYGGKWTTTTLYRMLTNEFYIGDLLLEKSYRKDPYTHKLVQNKGEKPMYYSENAHEAIISRELFGKVKAKIDANSKKWGPYASGNRRRSCFSGQIICGGCGRPMIRGIITRGDGTQKAVVWKCNSKVRKCNVLNPLEDDIKAIVADVLGLGAFSEEDYKKAVDHMEIGEDDILRVFLKSGEEKTYLLKRRKRGRNTFRKEGTTWQRK